MSTPTETRVWPTREGQWGVRQYKHGAPTGGGTVNCGWSTREDAEAQNPPCGDHTFEVFARWGGAA